MNITITSGLTTPRNKLSFKNQKFSNAHNFITQKSDSFKKSADTAFFTSTKLTTKKAAKSAIPSFTGITQSLPKITVNTVSDMINQWQRLKSAVFYEALDDKIYPYNKVTRAENFSFLNNVPSKIKQEFVEYFKEFTDFPNFKKVAENIEDEYLKRITEAARSISTEVNVIAAGYDPTCSVGLKRAFPGTDLDKAFVILENNSNYNDSYVVNNFKGHLWFNTDQRILSLNNEDTFPEVYTIDQVYDTLAKLNKLNFAITEKPYYEDRSERFTYFLNRIDHRTRRLTELEPIKAGLYNIEIAKRLPYLNISKEYAKNFAYFIESVRDGKYLVNDSDQLILTMNPSMIESSFVNYSSVTQMGAHKTKLKSGEIKMKTKLQLRKELETEFDKMNTDDQYDLVKEIIKSVSKDNDNPKFEKYFKNDDNIKERYDKLNRELLK